MNKGKLHHNNQNSSHKYDNLPPLTKIWNIIIDSVTDESGTWIQEQLTVGVPFTLDLLKEGLSKAVVSFFFKHPEQGELVGIREATYLDGLRDLESEKFLGLQGEFFSRRDRKR